MWTFEELVSLIFEVGIDEEGSAVMGEVEIEVASAVVRGDIKNSSDIDEGNGFRFECVSCNTKELS